MTIDTPDNNPQRPDRNPIEPAIPKELASEIVPKGGSLTQETLDFLAAEGVEVSPKVLAYVFLGIQHERFHHGSIANMRVTEHKGHAALIFHYKETETSDWETVVIVYPGFTKHQVYLLARAISSGRVQAIVIGELERYLSEGRYRAFPPYSASTLLNYPERLAELTDLLAKCKEARAKEAEARQTERTNAPTTLAADDTDAVLKVHLAYADERFWNTLWGFLLGVLLTMIVIYFSGQMAVKPDYLNQAGHQIISR